MREINEEIVEESISAKETFCLYLYTPICGTCQVATKMLTVVQEIKPELKMVKTNMNYTRTLAERFEIESVPCLLFFKSGCLQKKIYAFQSVPYVLQLMKDYIE